MAAEDVDLAVAVGTAVTVVVARVLLIAAMPMTKPMRTDLVSAAATLMLDRVTFNNYDGYWPRVAGDSAENLAPRRYTPTGPGLIDKYHLLVYPIPRSPATTTNG